MSSSFAQHLFAYAVITTVVVATLFPMFRNPPQDSFPLSDFPMFSKGRPDPFLTLTHVIGTENDGNEINLPPMITAANREVLQSMTVIAQSTHADVDTRAKYCATIARRVQEAGEVYGKIEQISLVTSRFNAVSYLQGNQRHEARTIHHECNVERQE